MTDSSILIVDDDPRICRLLMRIADSAGFQTLAIDNPEMFESAFEGTKPAVIFLDLQMAHLDGIELLRYLSNAKTTAAIYIVSGVDAKVLATTKRLGQSLGLNMAGVIQKPVDIELIKGELKKYLPAIDDEKTAIGPITEGELSKALESDEIVAFYQPKIDLASGKVTGVEALARWQHPTRGLIPPDDFIPLAESSDLILPLTFRVLEVTLQDANAGGWGSLSLSVNLSPSLLNDLELPDRINAMLEKYDLQPGRLILEVTESGAMENPTATMDILTRLRLKNIQLSIDDFGTGHSSLVQLYRLPYGELKIDKSFVLEMLESDEAAAIVRGTISLGRELGLTVTAEGVENRETAKLLADHGCHTGQGYYYSRPLEAARFSAWLKSYDSDAAT